MPLTLSPTDPNSTELSIVVEQVLFPKPEVEGDWFILRTDCGICKGNIAWRPSDGDRMILYGGYSVYQGQREFKFKTALPDVPDNPRDLLRYACDRTPGMGQSLEDSIWEKHGDKWRDVEAGDVKRFNDRLWGRFQQTLERLDAEIERTRVVSFLMGLGSTIAMASTAFDEWGEDTIGKVTADCYILSDLANYGFTNVDRSIRHHFQITDDDPRRVRAAIKYSIKQATSDGSTVVGWGALLEAIQKHTGGISAALVCENTKRMFNEGTLASFPLSQMVALARDYENERAVWEFVANVKEEKKDESTQV